MTQRRSAGRDAIIGAPATAADDTVTDPRFSMEPDGLYRREADGRRQKICGPFEALSETQDDDGQTWGLWLRFRDRDGTEQRLIATRDQFTGEGPELRNLLARRGLYINPARGAGALLCDYLAKLANPKRARVVSRTGWHHIDPKRVFIMPNAVFGNSPVEVVYQPSLREPSLFNTGGDLAGWRDAVAARCVGNTRLMLAVSAAFAAPLLEPMTEEGGGLHLRGASRVGKTTALRVAASVWGGEAGAGAGSYIRQWRVTSNAVEGVATAHSDTLLALDELGQADGRDVGGVAYMLANGQGKSRMDRGAALRAPLRFRTLFLSTGELGLADKIAEAGGAVKAGQEVRLVDISADAGAGLGLFQQLHGAASAADFTQALKDATTRFYGTAAPAFLRYLVDRLDNDPDLPADLRNWQDNLVRTWLADHADAGGQVRSVARRFALIAVAGELAAQAHITGWDYNEAATACSSCFTTWLAERGTAGAREDAQAVAQMAAFIGTASSRFEDWRDPEPRDPEAPAPSGDTPPSERFKVPNRAGWRRWMRQEDGRFRWVYYLIPAAMREALVGLDFSAALKVLHDRGFLDAAGGRSMSKTARPPGYDDKTRVYIIRPSILGASLGED